MKKKTKTRSKNKKDSWGVPENKLTYRDFKKELEKEQGLEEAFQKYKEIVKNTYPDSQEITDEDLLDLINETQKKLRSGSLETDTIQMAEDAFNKIKSLLDNPKNPSPCVKRNNSPRG